jgi:hypothetical protein
MTTPGETMLDTDLLALGAECRRDPRPLDDLLRAPGIYRDDEPGARARRDALAADRRLELATLPLSLAHVFAHRVARAAAGAVALACSAVVLLLAADPLLRSAAAWFVPGIELGVGVLAMLCGLAILASYVIASWVAESYFTRRMAHAIATTPDVYADLDQLARGPLALARGLVNRVDGWAVGLALAGIASLVSVFGYLVVVTGMAYPPSFALWKSYAIGSRLVTAGLVHVVAAIGVAVVLAVILGRACQRERADELATPGALRWFGHWATLPAGVLIGASTLYAVFRASHAYYRWQRPPETLALVLALGGVLAVFAVCAWAVLWWRRREAARCGPLVPTRS